MKNGFFFEGYDLKLFNFISGVVSVSLSYINELINTVDMYSNYKINRIILIKMHLNLAPLLNYSHLLTV